MEIQEITNQNAELQTILINYLENSDDKNDDYSFLIDLINQDIKLADFLKDFLSLLSNIINNHYITSNFYNNVEQILLFCQKYITDNITNEGIFNIFKKNKRVILFLLTKNIITIDESILNVVRTERKLKEMELFHFFYPEIKSLIDEEGQENIKKEMLNEDPEAFDNFEVKREKGQNPSHISDLIRNDSVEEFVSYTTKNNISLQATKIKSSIFETNLFLIENEEQSLIEYASFFGSIQIFQYLKFNNVELTPSLWMYAIHSKNAELIHLLEENNVEPEDKSFEKCFFEAIKCHHNEIANYIFDNLLDIEIKSTSIFNDEVVKYSLKYHNYQFFNENINSDFSFFYFAKYNHFKLCNCYLNAKKKYFKKVIISNQNSFPMKLN